MKLLDTSVAIDHLRGARPAVDLLSRVIEDEDAAATEVVRFELLAGVRDDEIEALEQFFSALSWVPVDEAVTRTAGSLARRHRRAHGGIDDADYLIESNRPRPRRRVADDRRPPLPYACGSPTRLLTHERHRGCARSPKRD